LHQFDALKRPAKDNEKNNNSDVDNHSPNKELVETELAELLKHAEKEEKEIDEGDDEDVTDLEEDLEEIQAAMREEIESAGPSTQPVCRVLYKVSGHQ
jgi:predicted transcriptional regulator